MVSLSTRTRIIALLQEHYPLDRVRRMEDMIKWSDANDCDGHSIQFDKSLMQLCQFIEEYGCVAKDFGMFMEDTGVLMTTWNVDIKDIKNGGRKRNTFIVAATFWGEQVMFEYDREIAPCGYQIGSEEMNHVIEYCRTC